MRFPVDAETDLWELEQAAVDAVFAGELDEEAEEAEEQLDVSTAVLCGQLTRDAQELEQLQQMHVALTRAQPIRRSCEVRLALTDWLHRRLRRGGLHTDRDARSFVSSSRLLEHRRIALARSNCTLHQQLSDLSA